jgi:excisionase family DNA binding protein
VALEPVYTVEQVAEFLQTSERTIQDHIRAGEIVAFPVGRGRERHDYRIDQSDLQKFKEEQKKGVSKPVCGLPTANRNGRIAYGETGSMADLSRPVVNKRRSRR